MNTIERETLRTLLRKWQAGELTDLQVYAEAEALWEQFPEVPQFSQDDPRSINVEVLLNLTLLYQQLITPQDIPALLAFLDTPPGKEKEGWQKLHDYWDHIDFEQRRKELLNHPYYSKYPVQKRRGSE
ncbi:hypothetical protein [Kallotenue papyrolyticum]|uniref:hypothetical protein n=1 Tax=Kallotenue papyrolyticum TaxID=1325125 RepID=UPI001268E030|nr:hypothetical protein [Kallotenue papyrolyticum]